MRLLNRIFVCTLLICAGVNIYSQDITITPGDLTKTYKGDKYQARIDFISDSPSLLIEENNGEVVQEAQKRNDGKYVYTCICDTRDTNKFGFNIKVKGDAALQKLPVFIEEHQLLEYNIGVVEILPTISEIKPLDLNKVVPEENIARVTITSSYSKLIIRSATGEKVAEPVANETKTFDYVVTFDLSTPESRTVERRIEISTDGKTFQPHVVGTLSPKQGMDIAVLVVHETCYQSNLNHARECLLGGLYRESYETYKKMIEDGNCKGKPDDISEEKKKMEDMKRLAAALILAQRYYGKAEQFQEVEQYDSCRHYHTQASQYRKYILKYNASDPYCREYEKKYDDYKKTAPRVLTGKVLNKARMDANGKNLPLEGAIVVLQPHKRENKKVNGVNIPVPGEKLKTEAKILGKTNGNGDFSVAVPHNTSEIIYVVYFTTEEDFKDGSYGYELIPEDKEFMKVNILLTPKKLNQYNKF